MATGFANAQWINENNFLPRAEGRRIMQAALAAGRRQKRKYKNGLYVAATR